MEAMREFLWALKRNKKYQIIALSVILAMGIGASVIVINILGRQGSSQATELNILENQSINETKSNKYLNGIPAVSGYENLYPIGIMIENLASTRPQKGLSRADLVYEALAEGGITRFLALFADEQLPSEVGPIRSARSYFIEWADEIRSVYMHCGGSPEALSLIPSQSIIDVNQMNGSEGYFARIKSKQAPHNLFTTDRLLVMMRRDKKVPDKGTYRPWKFKDEQNFNERPEGEKSLSIDFSTFSYTVEYKYDRASNDYLRFNGGEVHADALTQAQIRVKNVIIQKVDTSLFEKNDNRLKMVTSGEGDAIVFQDGRAIDARWKKDDERTRFYDTGQNEITLNPGTIWIEVVPKDRKINYK